MSLRILVVEDEQIVVADLEDKLKRLGHQVVGTTASGEEAVSLAGQLRPELILMDVRLQGSIDGIEAAGQIQRLTGAPVIFITAYAEVFLKDPSLMHPPGLCISKPFSIDQLRAVLDSVKT
jgi:two-component system cell cycle sensor histidine kinase/response regulator CckA